MGGRSLIYVLIAALLVMTAMPAFAAKDRVATGAKEVGVGVASIPRQIADTANRSNILEAVVVGTVKGVADAGKNIGEGIFKILTFYQGE